MDKILISILEQKVMRENVLENVILADKNVLIPPLSDALLGLAI